MKVFKNETAKKGVLDTYDQLLELWDVDKEERDIATTYGTTHVILCGKESNPPLILFHGVGDNSALMWLYNAKALAHHFRIFAIDTIGGPGKSCPNEHYNKDFDDIKWIDEVLDALSLGRVLVTGQSNGAYLAQYYALHRPARVIKVACIAGSLMVGEGSPMKMMMKIFLPEALFPTKRNTKKLLRKLCGKNSAVFTDNLIVMEHYQWLLKGFNNMAMRFHKIINFNDGQVASIRDKTLYLEGDSDPFMILGGKADLLQHKMNAKFFPEAGHALNHELADEINDILIDYLLDLQKVQ